MGWAVGLALVRAAGRLARARSARAGRGDGDVGAAAARVTDSDTKEVEVELVQDGSTLHITVADSGDGVAPDFAQHLFTEGASTRPDPDIPGGRGIGLALSRQIARALGGDVILSSRG